MSQNCPRCSNALELMDIDGIKIDRCGSCRGIFLDKYELNRMNAASETAIASLNDAAGSVASSKNDTGARIKCVRCAAVMETVNFSYTSGIMIDHCPACDSVWLYSGELAKIIEFMKASAKMSEEESAGYTETLDEIKAAAKQKKEGDFRAISSKGKMGSIVNFVYKMIDRISGE